MAYLEVSSGRKAEVAGKPHQAGSRSAAGPFRPGRAGGRGPARYRRPFAERIGAPFALVLSGVTRSQDLPVSPAPALVGRRPGRGGRGPARGGPRTPRHRRDQSANSCKHSGREVLGWAWLATTGSRSTRRPAPTSWRWPGPEPRSSCRARPAGRLQPEAGPGRLRGDDGGQPPGHRADRQHHPGRDRLAAFVDRRGHQEGAGRARTPPDGQDRGVGPARAP